MVGYILITLVFGIVCFMAGAVYYASNADGILTVKEFREDGTSVCNVQITLTPTEFRKRRNVVLRCMEVRNENN